MQTRILYKDGAQTLRHVPMSARGLVTRVSSATYQIVDLRESEDSADRVVASGSATLGSESATLAVAAGPQTANDRRLQVDAVTSFVAGQRYILEAADGQRELIELDRIDTGTTKYLYAMHPIRLTYAAGATVKAVELTASFPSAEASDESAFDDQGGPYQVVWDYTIDGRNYLVPEVVWVSRYSVAPFVTEQDVFNLNPTIVLRSRERLPMSSAILAGHEDYLVDLEIANLDPSYWRPTRASKLAVATKALAYLHRWQGTEIDSVEAKRLDDRYRELVSSRLTGRPDKGSVHVDPTNDDAPAGTSKRYGDEIFILS